MALVKPTAARSTSCAPTSARLLRQYQLYFHENRPHQGIGQRVPAKPVMDIDPCRPIEVTSVLGGLHVHYRRAA
jgi:hypothetical protein